ncbi:MAG: gamma-glutamyltransferase [Acholeplasmataceae bacterium]|jgi:gamma-glutamyltranspeptidase/glutathione hydrolase|nr:gamma-glutamyltransferase [Acholeplasmataceae bacterium]
MEPKQINQSIRQVVYAKHGMVATSEPQAAQAGLDILKKGGNAIDAAIAVAAALTVTEPTSNGIGGDNFAIIWHNNQLYGLNSSGPAPKLLSLDTLKKLKLNEMPTHGLIPVTVPGAVAGWAEMSKRFGLLSLKDALRPAIDYAKHGFVVQKTVAESWQRANSIYQKLFKDEVYASWFDTFTKNLQAPNQGDLWTLKDHAKTLEEIGDTVGSSFYRGRIADQIDQYSRKYNGLIRKSDLESFKPEWVEPIKVNYRGYDVYELPPNGQGVVALMALNILENFDFKDRSLITTSHRQIEAIKLAFADGLSYISDPKTMETSIQSLLSKNYAWKRSREIKTNAIEPKAGKPIGSGTVYLAVADKDGNMVSMIQSNYMGFGSGIVVPKTGIALHNRGHNFSLNPKSNNVVEPDKRPYHTIIPGFLMKNRTAIGPFGVMGGFMQPQGHVQVLMNMIDFKMDPQEALDAPRFQWVEHKKIWVEPDYNPKLINGLIKKGHEIIIEPRLGQFGRGQIIMRDSITGVYVGGTEKRCDSTIASY